MKKVAGRNSQCILEEKRQATKDLKLTDMIIILQKITSAY